MDQWGDRSIEVTVVDNKWQITAVFCGLLTGDFLPVQLVYGGKTGHWYPHSMFPSDWDITHALSTVQQKKLQKSVLRTQYILPYSNKIMSAIIIINNFKDQIRDQIV